MLKSSLIPDMFKSKAKGFIDRLDGRYRRVTSDSKVFGLSTWKNRGTINRGLPEEPVVVNISLVLHSINT